MLKFITDFLAQILDGFKQKNPGVYAVIAIVLLSVYYITGLLVDYTNPDGSQLLTTGLQETIEVVRNVIIAVLTLIGAHTPKNVSEDSKNVLTKP